MNIALVGYGRMGQIIEQMAQNRGHQIPIKINSKNFHLLSKEHFDKEAIDVAIEFTTPEAAFSILSKLASIQIPTVSGSTGWLNQYNELVDLVKENNTAFLYASNFSLGVNLFFKMTEQLAKILNRFDTYQAEILEIHHTGKKDAPSGTAITIAEKIIQHQDQYQNWNMKGGEQEGDIPIQSKRIDPTPGTHRIRFSSDIDDIELTHIAHNRKGFALGAILAAEYICNKKGIYNMQDVLNV